LTRQTGTRLTSCFPGQPDKLAPEQRG